MRTTVYEDSAVMADLQNRESVKHTVRIDSRLLDKLDLAEGQGSLADRLRQATP